MNSKNEYTNQLENKNYDFDYNYSEEKYSKMKQFNGINNINTFLKPTIQNDKDLEPDQEQELEKEKEIELSLPKISLKNNNFLFIPKKPNNSFIDKSEKIDKIENIFLNNYRINQNINSINTNTINSNMNKNIICNMNLINNNMNYNQDDDFIRQKQLLTQELHNWNRNDEESD